MLRPLRTARRSRRVVQHRRCLGARGVRVVVIDARLGVEGERELTFLQRLGRGIDNDDAAQPRQARADPPDLGQVLLLRDDGGRAGVVEACPERLLAEGREERLRDATELENAEQADVELRHAVHEQADRLAGPEALPREPGGDRVGELAQVVEGIGARRPVGVAPDQGRLRGEAEGADAIAAIPGDVDRVSTAIAQFGFGQRPVELRDEVVVCLRLLQARQVHGVDSRTTLATATPRACAAERRMRATPNRSACWLASPRRTTCQ